MQKYLSQQYPPPLLKEEKVMIEKKKKRDATVAKAELYYTVICQITDTIIL